MTPMNSNYPLSNRELNVASGFSPGSSAHPTPFSNSPQSLSIFNSPAITPIRTPRVELDMQYLISQCQNVQNSQFHLSFNTVVSEANDRLEVLEALEHHTSPTITIEKDLHKRD
jgi:hypothetical protein